MTWFRKFAALLLLSLGCVLVFMPFPSSLSGERTRDVVQLQVESAPLTEESARARFGDSFIVLSYEDMDEYPEMREAVLGLMGRSSSRCVPSREWQSLLAERSIVNPDGLAYAFRDDVHRISSVETRDPGAEGELVCFSATMLGAFDNHDWGSMARLDVGDLEAYPELKAELERLAAGPIPAEGGRDISPRQWRRFKTREVDSLGDSPDFVVFDRLFRGMVSEEPAPWSLRTPWLRQTARAIGVVVLILGFFMAVASYRAIAARPGIPVSSPWLAVFCDLISLVAGLIFVAVAIDTLWVGPLGQPSLLGLHPEWPSAVPITGLHFVSLLVVFIALPLLTLWFTGLSAQRIQIDAERVTSHGALGSRSISWQDLEQVRLRAQRNPFSFTVVDFRKLQRVLDLEGAEVSLTINEPGSRQRKREILNTLLLYVPEGKKNLIKDVEVEW
jgi:hypothetical protein